MDRPRSSAHLQPKSKTTSTLPSTSTTTPHATANKSINSSNAAAQLPTSSPETPPTRRGGWSDFSPIKLSPLKLAPSSPYSPSSRDHSPSRDSPDLFEAHTQLDQSPSSSPATPVVYQGSTPPLTPPIDRSPGSDTLTRDTLQREVTQLDLVELKNKKSDRSLNDRSPNDRSPNDRSPNDRSPNDRSLNDRSMTRLLRMETRLDVDDMSHSAPVTDVKRKPALMSADTTADLLTRTTTVLDATKNSTNRSTLSTSTELLSRATTLLDIPLPNTATHHAVKWQLIGQGALNGHVIELQEGSAVQVGRGSGCVGASELSAHKVISAVHISLVVREQHCWLTDLSSNGTWLNGLRLETQLQTPLRTGDLVELGKHNKGGAVALLVRAKRLHADQGTEQARDRDKRKKVQDEELITRLVEDEIILRRYGNLNEGQYHAKQREIDKLWQQDENSLNFLRDSLRNSNDVTNKMVGVLKTFDDRLKHLLGSIQQIHHSTTKWKNVYKNIDSGLSNFKDVIELFDTAATAKPKLSAGVSAVGVNEYLEVMDKLQTAISYFMNNTELKSATKTLDELQRLQADATVKLKAHYEQVLRGVSSPADPTQLRVDVTESKSSREVRMTASGQVLAPGSVLITNEQTLSELNKMIKRLDLNKESSYLSLYTTVRSEYVLATLAKLQPHKMLQMFADSEATTSGYMRGTHPCIQFISALLVLLFTERNLIARLLPAKHVTAQFRAVLEPSMQQLSELSDGIIKLQRRNANRQYAVCVLLDLWAHVTALTPQYCAALTAFEDEETQSVKRGKTPAGTSLLSPVITKFSEDLTENTREILSEVKGQWSGGNSSALSLVSPEGLSRALAVTSWSVPSDGTVAQQTVMAVQFLSALFPYKEIVVNLLPTLQPISGKSPLAVYIIRSLEELIDTMETRAKKEKKSQALTAIYLLNNYYFIWKGVKSNAELSKEVGSQVLDGYQKRVEEQKELYKRTWSKCSEYFEDRELKTAQGTKLHSAIKHCLSGFNAEFEDNFSNQVQFFIADDDLRTALRGELMALLVPPYKQFLSKYGHEEFAKKKDKYLKYSAESLEGMISKFFDGALTKGKQLLTAATNN